MPLYDTDVLQQVEGGTLRVIPRSNMGGPSSADGQKNNSVVTRLRASIETSVGWEGTGEKNPWDGSEINHETPNKMQHRQTVGARRW